jgi:hypothetical protein
MNTGRRALFLAGCLLLAATPALAVNGGQLDAGAHPAVGFIFGTLGTDPCASQVIGCSGVLIDPSVFLTSGGCADVFLHPENYGYNLAAVWVTFDGDNPFGACASASLVSQIVVNPGWVETSPTPAGDVGVLILASPAPVAASTLPTAGEIATLPSSQPYKVVAYGDDDGGTGTSLATLARRSSDADFKSLSSEVLTLTLARAAKGLPHTCIGAENEAGGAYLGTTNEVVALVISPTGGNCRTTDYQRLDVPSVRGFLANYVTLP